ncbi:ATP-dependent helicase HrpB [Myxococcus stipitatus]|uniref:ATP-dependent helicase HrpB n=1 Tax=Myxococcus stipitatus TaxID=83455 RepID=UPI0030CBA7D0
MTTPLTAAPASLPPTVTQSQGGAPAEKLDASRFDDVLSGKAQGVTSTSTPRDVSSVGVVPPVAGTAKSVLNGISRFVRELEVGQGVLDGIIQSASSGARFSNTELLSLQASMYRYAQALDLVSRVVEKGSTGLRDVLKTQV